MELNPVQKAIIAEVVRTWPKNLDSAKLMRLLYNFAKLIIDAGTASVGE